MFLLLEIKCDFRCGESTYIEILICFMILCPRLQIFDMVLKTPLHLQKLDTHH